MDNEQRAVLAHVVEDPDAWWEHCQATMGGQATKALRDKVDRWRESYRQASVAEGYKPRAQRPEAAPALPAIARARGASR